MINQSISKKLEQKKAKICVLGLGYVGLPMALSYVENGFTVFGIDVDKKKIESLNSGKSYIKQIPSRRIKEANKRGFYSSSDFSKINDSDALIICVPTPLNEFREPELSFVVDSVDASLPFLKKGQVIALVSTTYPGTTEEELLPRIESTGLKVGQDVFLIFAPEREDPGNRSYDTSNTPKIIGGHTKDCLEVGICLFNKIVEQVVPVSSTKVAEMSKLLENIYRAVNIGLVNDMKKTADKMNIDIFEVINAAATKPFGYKAFYPGPGLGGHCIPIDPFYLSWKARQFGLYNHFIELAGEINSDMPFWVTGKVTEILNNNSKAINGSNILLLGVAYKKNIDDIRESPAIPIIDYLISRGSKLSYSDPFVKSLNRKDLDNKLLKSIDLSPSMIKTYDLVLLITDHDTFDFDMIRKNAKILVDTRGIFPTTYKNVYRA